MPGRLKFPFLIHSIIDKKEKYRKPNGAHQKLKKKCQIAY